jgi:formylmethanofuran dehydrogenase subunit E
VVNRKRSATINAARKFHGHLGPFLVIGVRMGEAALKQFNLTGNERLDLKANVKVPLQTPFSCLLDGIQIATTCTIGNQRLTIQNSDAIQAAFTTQKQAKTIKITIKETLDQQLKQKQTQNELTEEYAHEIADMPENQLFNITLSN